MRGMKIGMGVALACGFGLAQFGCISSPNRTSNQGGGSILTAAAKLAGGQLSSLTPDEIQVATDFAIDNFGLEVPSLEDEQAEAVVTFLNDNNLNSVEDIQALADNPGDVVVSDDVKDAIESLLRGLGEDIDFEFPVDAQGADGPAGANGDDFPPFDPSQFPGFGG